MGRALILIGGIIVLIGFAFLMSEKIPWLGRLPGDFYIKREKFGFYFPLATSILISLILTIVIYLLKK